jgi:Uma2 family endonuclease
LASSAIWRYNVLMSTLAAAHPKPEIVYPDSDGQPMADNTKQFRCIVMIQGGLDAQYRDEPSVFVAGDLLWYPVEGEPTIRSAPDTMVVFGRPKGDRGPYRQWQEGHTAPQVTFEVLSPGNRPGRMVEKFRFYERYGVEEYYVYDPDWGELSGWIRKGERLEEIPNMIGWVSPKLGVRFEMDGSELRLIGRDGHPFATYVELVTQMQKERERGDRLAAQLRAKGIEPEA